MLCGLKLTLSPKHNPEADARDGSSLGQGEMSVDTPYVGRSVGPWLVVPRGFTFTAPHSRSTDARTALPTRPSALKLTSHTHSGSSDSRDCSTQQHTHTRLTALCPELPGSAGTRKVKPIWILLKQETVGGSGITWAICKSAPRSRQITTPAPHQSVFYMPDALPAAQPTASQH